MSELLSAERWAILLENLRQAFVEHVLVLSNVLQLAATVLIIVLAWLIARALRPWLDRPLPYKALERLQSASHTYLFPGIWLLLQWLCVGAAMTLGWPSRFLVGVLSLLAAWIVIRLASQLVTRPIWATMITWVAWSIAALNILGWLPLVNETLDAAALTVGSVRISLLNIVHSTLALAVLISLAIYLTDMLDARIRTSQSLSPSLKVLLSKSLKTVLVGVAIIVSFNLVGINLTAIAVVGGALGVGIGFGLQKIVSNLISGVILLVDKSIKPGDVIAVAGTYGWVTALGGRYVSVVTRDGIEHLIPNEMLISERVENWTHSNSKTRLKIDVGVHYKTDVRHAMALCIDAAREQARVLNDPEPRCMLLEFGDSAIMLQLRVWIADAQNGVQNIKSAILLSIWDRFREHGIEIPYPQRDLHVRSWAPPGGAHELSSDPPSE